MSVRILVPLMGAGIAAAVACSGGDSTPTAVPTTAVQPSPTARVEVQPPDQLEELGLVISSPSDGAEVSSSAVNVVGTARQDAVVAVNGQLVDVDASGTWQARVGLIDLVNEIEVTASSDDGTTEYQSVIVFLIQELATPSLLIQSPADGYVTSSNSVTVSGTASPDAIVVLNGIPAKIDIDGLFTASAQLEPGANLIEVSSVSPDGTSSSDSIIVFNES